MKNFSLLALLALVGLLSAMPQTLSPPPAWQLTITATTGGATDPALGTYVYNNGTVVDVTAIPNPGFSFDHWLFDEEERVENPTTIIMVASKTLHAVFVDDNPPEIGVPTQEPPDDVTAYQNVTVMVNVTDLGTGVQNVTLWHSIDNGTIWIYRDMTHDTANTYRGTIPGYENGTWLAFKIVAYDNQGNQAVNDNHGTYFKYQVIPEFPSVIILPLFIIMSLLTIIIIRRERTHARRSIERNAHID